MEVRAYSPLDWLEIKPWFEAREWPNIESVLPPVGWVVCDPKPLAAIWLYQDHGIGWLAHPVTRPKTGTRALKALNLCIAEAQAAVEALGIKVLFQFMSDDRMIKFYEKNGFIAQEKGTMLLWHKGV